MATKEQSAPVQQEPKGNEIVESWNQIVGHLAAAQKLWGKHGDIYRAKQHTLSGLSIEAQKILLPAFHRMTFPHFLDFIARYARGNLETQLTVKEAKDG